MALNREKIKNKNESDPEASEKTNNKNTSSTRIEHDSVDFQPLHHKRNKTQNYCSFQHSQSSLSAKLPYPLYQRVKHFIIEQISNGVWKPDTKILSENELVKTLNVSRMTVHRALRELTADGHLVRIQGVGTFVAAPKPQLALFEIKSIADEIKSRGRIHGCEIHLLQQEIATADLVESVGLKPGTLMYHSIIVHRDSGVAIQLADRYVNPVLFPDYLAQDFTKITPAEYLLETSPVTEAEHIIETMMPNDQIANLLEIESSEPCLLLHRRTWTHGTLGTCNRFVYPGAHYKIGGRFKPLSISHQIMPI